MVRTRTRTNEIEDEPNVMSLGSARIKDPVREQVNLTPKLCREHLELNEFMGERPHTPSWSEHLTSEMVRGTFRFEHVQFMRARMGNEMFRVNGQHTSHARLDLEDEKQYSKPIQMLTYEVDTLEDLRNLYATVDQGMGRKRVQVIMAQLVGCLGWAHVSNKAIKNVASGFALWQWEDATERKRRDALQVAFYLKTSHMELGTKVGRFLTDRLNAKTANHVHKGPVVGAMLGTFDANPAEAEVFWTSVAEGTGFTRTNDPRNRLCQQLLKSSVEGSRKAAAKGSLTPEEMLRMCYSAWNAWRKGEDRTTLQFKASGARPRLAR